jgi:hypothetical protein
MTVTTETYTATTTWTAAELADLFKDAFIDAGLMTDWYDSFLNTIENRILEVQYDGAKTYGKTYYWFQFTTGGVFLHVATGWNSTTHVPTGTQYIDYFSTSTNTTSNHRQLVTLSASTTATLTRYTSAINTDFSWFLLKNGTTTYNFHVPDAGAPEVSWLDLNKVLFCPFVNAFTQVSSTHGFLRFRNNSPQLRRSYLGSTALRGATDANSFVFIYWDMSHYGYCGLGNASASVFSNIPNNSLESYTVLPVAFNNTNPAYSTDQVPVFTGVNYNQYLSESMPADFGISFHYANNTMAVLDKLIVTASTEEWEMLAVTNSTSTPPAGVSPMFLARVV